MKFISRDKLLDIGCGGLRCGRWAIFSRNRPQEGENLPGGRRYNQGYHSGKFYADMYVLSLVGKASIVWPANIKSYKNYLKDFHKGKMVVFKGKFDCDVIMDKKFFYDILSVPNENYSKSIISDIIKMSPEVK